MTARRCDYYHYVPNWGIGTSLTVYRCRLEMDHEGFHQWESERERQAFEAEFTRHAKEPLPWAS